MPTTTAARKKFESELATLVARFDGKRDEYLRSDYNESLVRLQFIDPLFEALGWDVRDKAGKGRNAQVLVARGETIGIPDYTFRIDGVTKFYVEAKAPHVSLEKSSAALQAKKYAWNTPEPFVYFAVATDFEEFRFYDASLKPDPKHPHVGLIFAYRYPEYLTHKGLDDLWQLSHESVVAGSLDKLLKPSARAARARAPLDQEFLSDLTLWREKLAKSIFKAHSELTNPIDLNNVVQILLDRLIFIRVAEDRSVLEAGRLVKIARAWKNGDHDRSIMAELLLYFREVNERLNGEIFKKHKCEELHWDSALVAEIVLEGLEPYDFNKIGVELLGSIYERYLGKTIRVTETRAIVEDKPEVRKAGGVYYTPKYIVDYIVEQTVGKLIEGKTPKQIEKLKILDPACGSGSFLIGAYQKLIDYHAQYLAKRSNQRKGGGGNGGQAMLLEERAEYGEFKLPLEQKAAILRNNIFGLDIDPQAVEITMMSLYIKMLEGERGAIMGQGVLPRLNENIKCGNSLIARDIDVTGDERVRINPFDWDSKSDGFGEIMDAGSFDAVIGNPPYIPMETMSSPEKEYFQQRFSQLERKYDSSIVFILAMLQKLKRGGRLGFISSITWQTGENYGKLRQHLFTKAGVVNLVNLPFNVFKGAYVDTGIYILTDKPTDAYSIYCFPKKEREPNLNSLEFMDVQTNLIASPNYKVVLEPQAWAILSRVANDPKFVPLGDFTISTQGLAGNLFEPSAKPKGTVVYPFLEKGQVYRYDSQFEQISYVDMVDKPSLTPFYDGNPKLLIRRVINRQDRLMSTYTEEKIVFKKDINPFVMTGSTWNAYYVLGILNSRLISFLYVRASSIATKDDFRQTTLAELRRLPIRTINFDNPADKSRHDKMVALVEKMLDLHKQKQATTSDAVRERIEREINVIDEQIDALVYELYGLTKDEIKIVEQDKEKK